MNWKIFKRTVIFVLLAQIANVDCDLKSMATRKSYSVSEFAKTTEGWGGSPDLLQKGENPLKSNLKEYFYTKIAAKASAKSIEQDSDLSMNLSCKEAAGLSGAFEILTSFMDAHLKEKKLTEETGIVTLPLDGTNSYSCKYFQSEDGKVKSKKCSGVLQNRGTAECWPTASGNSWETCECLVYIKFQGGKAAVLQKLHFSE